MRSKKLFVLLSVFFSFTLSAQELLPFVENFTKTDYTGDNQVWNVVQGTDKAMYFANNHFLLRYNSVGWEKYALPNKTIIRSVFSDGDKIYCGSYKEFGFWQRNAGKMHYTSLSKNKQLFLGSSDNEEIWKIFKHNGTIYFQAFNELYRYDGKNVTSIKFPTQVSYCYVVDNVIYAASVRNGVYRMEGNTFVFMASWPQLKETVVHGIEKCGTQVFIFTKNNGIYTGDTKAIAAWNNPVNALLKNDVILTAKVVNNHTLAIGTALRGLYIIDIDTGDYKNINRKNALKNNAVLSIAADGEKNLWLGLDNGIAHIEINSPISLFTDNSGILGSVYALSQYKDGFLFATNHGLFTYNNNQLQPVPQSQGQVWDIYQNGQEYIIGHNDGTFIYNGSALVKANPVNGGWNFIKSPYDNTYFQTNYSGIAVYNDINNTASWKVLNGITKPIKNIAQTRPGELWAADNYRGLYRILYNSNFDVKSVENISEKNKILPDFGVKIFPFKNEVLFYINNTWYTYNRLTDKLEKNSQFQEAFSGIADIIPVDESNFIVVKNNQLYCITQLANTFYWKLIPEKYYKGRLILENMRAYKSGNVLYINLDDGFLAYNLKTDKPLDLHLKAEAFYQGNLITDNSKISYNQPVEINVTSGYYGFSRPELFYRLNNETGYLPLKNGNVILNNLGSGRQQIEVFHHNGLKYVSLLKSDFTVSKPWYFSVYMIIAYLLLIGCIFFLYYRWNHVRYRQKIRLNEEELRHRTQIMELEMEAENKLRQEQHERHMLEAEVQNKASEVAGKSLSIAKHSEMIESIQDVLDAESNTEQLKSKIRKIIKTNSINKNEWQSFEKNLLKSHEEFVARLTGKFPELTPKDIKLSIYLKMNLSSKEIAPLMNISYRGVELHRYRLRKKLLVTQEESLYKFMISI